MKKSKDRNRRTSYPEGSMTTGCCDVMVGRGKDGTLMRLYYPTSLSHIDDHQERWTDWYLGSKYSQGLGKFFMPWIYPGYQVITDLLTKKCFVPAVWEAPVAEGKFPVVVFSHGLSTHRSLYSSICNDLASHGFIVAAIEHRDRSACATFTIQKNGRKNWTLIKTVNNPKYEFDLRLEQVKIRAKEVSRVLDVLERLNEGTIKENDLPSSLPMEEFKGRIRVDDAVLAGHSFGGGTTLLALSKEKRFKGGICLDPWLFPLDGFYRSQTSYSDAEIAEMEAISSNIEQPLLFILMERFQDKQNLEAIKKYDKEKNEIWTLLKASHQNQTDTPMVFKESPVVLKKIIGCSSSINPDVAMKLNNNLMVNFLSKILNYQIPCSDEYQNYILRNSQHTFEGPKGTAKHMAGWHTKIIKK